VSPLEHVTAYVAVGMLRALVQTPPGDHTIATHHFLVGDLRHLSALSPHAAHACGAEC
jgi:hypothetical protein